MKNSIRDLQELKAILAEWEYESKYINAVRKSIKAIETLQMAENDIEWQLRHIDDSEESQDFILGKKTAYEDVLMIVGRAWSYFNADK